MRAMTRYVMPAEGLGNYYRVMGRGVPSNPGMDGFWSSVGKVAGAPFKYGAKGVKGAARLSQKMVVGTTKLAFAPFKFGINVAGAVASTAARAGGGIIGSALKLPLTALKAAGSGVVTPFAPSPGGGGSPPPPSPELQSAAMQAAAMVGYGAPSGGGPSSVPLATDPATGEPLPDGTTFDPVTGKIVKPGLFGLSTPALVGIAGGGVVLLYLLMRKKGGGHSSAPKS